MNRYPKSHDQLDKIANLISNEFGDEYADDYVVKRLIDLYDIIERGTLAIRIAKDMDALNEN